VLNLAGAAGGIRRGDRDGRSHVDGLHHELAIEIDSVGSPVSVPAAEWFVCFVPGLQKQWWHRFTNAKHQHVFAIRMVDDGCWLLVEPWWTRMLVSVLTLDEALKFLRWGAAGDILRVREAVPGRGNQVRGWSNCAVLIAFLLGRQYRTWTPHGLYRRLVAERGAHPVDLAQWLASHVRAIATRNAEVLEALEVDESQSLRTVLLNLGKGIMSALMSRSALGLHKASISESGRFGAATNAYWECGLPQRSIEAVRKVLQQAQLRGEIDIDDPAVAARQFVAMLRGDIHLEILFGLRNCPDATEIHVRVKSVVDLLMDGAVATNLSALKPTPPRRCIDASRPDIHRHPERCVEEAEYS
jgi:hypothetical protein